MEPNIVFGLCIGCFLIGLAIGYALFRGGNSTATEKAEKAEAELTEYKEAVNEHFGQTAEHFKALGRNYRELYEHMARGSESLMGGADGAKAVPFMPMEQLLAAPDEDSAVENVVAEQKADETQAPPTDETPSQALAESTDTPLEETTPQAPEMAEPDASDPPAADDAFAEETVDDIRLADAATDPGDTPDDASINTENDRPSVDERRSA